MKINCHNLIVWYIMLKCVKNLHCAAVIKNAIFNGIGGGLLGYYIIRWKVSLSVALLAHLLVADL